MDLTDSRVVLEQIMRTAINDKLKLKKLKELRDEHTSSVKDINNAICSLSLITGD